jgi:hypothetical protein
VVPIQVQAVVLVVEDLCGIGVPGVASHVVREHENDVVVWDAQPLDRPVERQGVGNVPVVEPEGNQTPALCSPAIAHQFFVTAPISLYNFMLLNLCGLNKGPLRT